MSLFRTAARVGVATSVHGRVRQRQNSRWAESAAATARTSASAPDRLEELRRLGELRASGVLTDREFEAQKARLLGS